MKEIVMQKESSSQQDKSPARLISKGNSLKRGAVLVGQGLKKYDPQSLFLLTYKNCYRKWCLKIIESMQKYSYFFTFVFSWFDRFILVIIFSNSLIMALNDYTDPNNATQWNQILEQIGLAFTVIFAIECLLKISAMGLFLYKNSYLRDPWNIIDLVAVVVGGLEFIPTLPNLKVIRTMRIVRPLKSIKALPSMRRLINSLLNSLPALANVVVFLLFVFMLFGIFGIQIFQGNFYQCCRLTPLPDKNGYWPINLTATNLCQYDSDCPTGNYCGSSEAFTLSLSTDTDIQEYVIIFYGITNFDNILSATLTIFQVITLEGWTQLMYDMSDSGQPVVSPMYFCLLVVIGSFFLLNLNLAVIMNEFTKVDDKFKEEQERQKNLKDILIMQQENENDDQDENQDNPELQRSNQQRDSDLRISSFSQSQLRLTQQQSANLQNKLGLSFLSVPQSGNQLAFKRFSGNSNTQNPAQLLRSSTVRGKQNGLQVNTKITDRFLSIGYGVQQKKRNTLRVSSLIRQERLSSIQSPYLRSQAKSLMIIGRSNIQKQLTIIKDIEGQIDDDFDESHSISSSSVRKSDFKNQSKSQADKNSKQNYKFSPMSVFSKQRKPQNSQQSMQFNCQDEGSKIKEFGGNSPLPYMSDFKKNASSQFKRINQSNSKSHSAPRSVEATEYPEIGQRMNVSSQMSLESLKEGVVALPSERRQSLISNKRQTNQRSSSALILYYKKSTTLGNKIISQNRKRISKMGSLGFKSQNLTARQAQNSILVATLNKFKDDSARNKYQHMSDIELMRLDQLSNQSRLQSESIKVLNNSLMLIQGRIKNHEQLKILEVVNKVQSNQDSAEIQANGRTLDSSITQSNATEDIGQDLEVQAQKRPSLIKLKSDEEKLIDEIEERSKKNKLYTIAFKICTHGLFSLFILLLILVNTVLLAMDRYPIPKDEDIILENTNNYLTIGFVLEMGIKLIGLGPRGYAKDKFNIFDCFIVLISTAEIILSEAELSKGFSSSGAISAFRAIRLLRIFKLARSWKSFQEILIKIGKTLMDISNFIILLFIFIFTYAMLGMELFAFKCRFDDKGNPINLEPYGGQSAVVGTSPRENFDTFLSATIIIFIVLIGDNWNNIMYNYARAVGMGSIIFFVVLVILGKFILMNLFLAILLRNFGDSDFRKPEDSGLEETVLEKIKRKFSGYYHSLSGKLKIMPSPRKSDMDLNTGKSSQYPFKTSDFDSQSAFMNATGPQNFEQAVQQTGNQWNRSLRKIDSMASSEPFQIDVTPGPEDNLNSRRELITPFETARQNVVKVNSEILEHHAYDGDHEAKKNDFLSEKNINQGSESQIDGIVLNSLERIQKSYKEKLSGLEEKRRRKKTIYVSKIGHSNEMYKLHSRKFSTWINPYTLDSKSLYLFGRYNQFRNFVAKVMNHKLFDPFILFVIALSTITLALDNPLNDPNGRLTYILSYFDIIFTVAFGLEFTIKVITHGFVINGSQSYLRNPWNILDFVILVFSFISIFPNGVIDFKFMKSIRLLRVVRPLRVISRNQGLKIAVLSLLNSILGIFHVFTISFLFFILFGIFGINYFKGQFYYCKTDQLPFKDQINVFDKWSCFSLGGEWINLDHNFDNLFKAIKTLFEMSTTEGWTDVMYAGIDANGVDQAPNLNNKPLWSIFFMLFILFGSLFIMNLFVGVVINAFNAEREKLGKNHVLSPFQRQWILIQVSCLKLKPQIKQEKIYKSRIRNFVSYATYSNFFEQSILICIILNTICLAIEWYNQPMDVNSILENINYGFAAIFTLEFVLKLYAQGFRTYFSNGWNIFDTFVVIITIASVFLTIFTSQNLGASTTFIRSFKIGRVLRIVAKAGFLRTIFNTFVVTLPSLANIGGLLILITYVFSILGTFLFADVQLQTNLDQHANFQDFIHSFLTLIRCATGESWNYIMDDCARSYSILFQCASNPTFQDYEDNGYVTLGCGDSTTAYAYFFTFTILVSMIFLNLFIAIILESFENINQQEDLKIKDSDLLLFQKLWLPYDTKGAGYIEVHQFENFMIDLVNQKSQFIREGDFLMDDFTARRHFIEELELPTYHKMKYYHFYDILSQLSKAAIQIDLIQGKYYEKKKEDFENLSQKSKDSDDNKQQVMILEQEEQNLDAINVDEEIILIEELNEKHKIQLVATYHKLKERIEDSKNKYLDKFEGNIYNSRFVFLIMQMKAKIKLWIMRKQKEKEIKQRIALTFANQPINLAPITFNKSDLDQEAIMNPFQTESSSGAPKIILSQPKREETFFKQQIIRKTLTRRGDLISSQEDSSSEEIQNQSDENNGLQSAKEKFKETRGKRRDLIFKTNKISANNQMSTVDSDLNSLIKQLSGNLESQNSGGSGAGFSLRESEQSETLFELARNEEAAKEQEEKNRKKLNQQIHLNTIISDRRQEESFSTQKINQRQSEHEGTSGVSQESPRSLGNAGKLSNPILNNEVLFKTSIKGNQSQQQIKEVMDTNEQMYLAKDDFSQRSQKFVQLNNLLNTQTDQIIKSEKLSKNKEKNKLQLTVSFGMSDNQVNNNEDFSDVKLFIFNDNLKNSDHSNHKLPMFEDESPINKNESIHKDSPKFSQNRTNLFKELTKAHESAGKSQAHNLTNLRQRLSELIQNKEDQQKTLPKNVVEKVSQLLSKNPIAKHLSERNLHSPQSNKETKKALTLRMDEHEESKQSSDNLLAAFSGSNFYARNDDKIQNLKSATQNVLTKSPSLGREAIKNLFYNKKLRQSAPHEEIIINGSLYTDNTSQNNSVDQKQRSKL